MDYIFIQDLVLKARVGVTEPERLCGQVINIDLKVFANLSDGAESDSLSETISYSIIKKKVEKIIAEREFRLLERIGAVIGDDLLEYSAKISVVKVRIKKPGIWASGIPGISITRKRA